MARRKDNKTREKTQRFGGYLDYSSIDPTPHIADPTEYNTGRYSDQDEYSTKEAEIALQRLLGILEGTYTGDDYTPPNIVELTDEEIAKLQAEELTQTSDFQDRTKSDTLRFGGYLEHDVATYYFDKNKAEWLSIDEYEKRYGTKPGPDVKTKPFNPTVSNLPKVIPVNDVDKYQSPIPNPTFTTPSFTQPQSSAAPVPGYHNKLTESLAVWNPEAAEEINNAQLKLQDQFAKERYEQRVASELAELRALPGTKTWLQQMELNQATATPQYDRTLVTKDNFGRGLLGLGQAENFKNVTPDPEAPWATYGAEKDSPTSGEYIAGRVAGTALGMVPGMGGLMGLAQLPEDPLKGGAGILGSLIGGIPGIAIGLLPSIVRLFDDEKPKAFNQDLNQFGLKQREGNFSKNQITGQYQYLGPQGMTEQEAAEKAASMYDVRSKNNPYTFGTKGDTPTGGEAKSVSQQPQAIVKRIDGPVSIQGSPNVDVTSSLSFRPQASPYNPSVTSINPHGIDYQDFQANTKTTGSRGSVVSDTVKIDVPGKGTYTLTPEVHKAITKASELTGVPESVLWGSWAYETIGGSAKSYNASTQATGLFQVTPAAFIDVNRNYGNLLKEQGLKADKLSDLFNPEIGAAYGALYKKLYTTALTGSEPTSADYYLAHNLGPGDRNKFFSALRQNDTASVGNVLRDAVISGNPAVYGKNKNATVGVIYDKIAEAMDSRSKSIMEQIYGKGEQKKSEGMSTLDRLNQGSDIANNIAFKAPMYNDNTGIGAVDLSMSQKTGLNTPGDNDSNYSGNIPGVSSDIRTVGALKRDLDGNDANYSLPNQFSTSDTPLKSVLSKHVSDNDANYSLPNQFAQTDTPLKSIINKYNNDADYTAPVNPQGGIVDKFAQTKQQVLNPSVKFTEQQLEKASQAPSIKTVISKYTQSPVDSPVTSTGLNNVDINLSSGPKVDTKTVNNLASLKDEVDAYNNSVVTSVGDYTKSLKDALSGVNTDYTKGQWFVKVGDKYIGDFQRRGLDTITDIARSRREQSFVTARELGNSGKLIQGNIPSVIKELEDKKAVKNNTLSQLTSVDKSLANISGSLQVNPGNIRQTLMDANTSTQGILNQLSKPLSSLSKLDSSFNKTFGTNIKLAPDLTSINPFNLNLNKLPSGTNNFNNLSLGTGNKLSLGGFSTPSFTSVSSTLLPALSKAANNFSNLSLYNGRISTYSPPPSLYSTYKSLSIPSGTNNFGNLSLGSNNSIRISQPSFSSFNFPSSSSFNWGGLTSTGKAPTNPVAPGALSAQISKDRANRAQFMERHNAFITNQIDFVKNQMNFYKTSPGTFQSYIPINSFTHPAWVKVYQDLNSSYERHNDYIRRQQESKAYALNILNNRIKSLSSSFLKF